jgi:hypothetical protein
MEEIRSSRGKTALCLAGSLALFAGSLLGLQHPGQDGGALGLGAVFFGMCAAMFAWLLVRPQRLLLDHEGFAVAGGLVRTPRKVLWRDVELFFVYRLPRGGKMVGFNYRAQPRDVSPMARPGRRFGADGALPRCWPGSPEAMVERLNARLATARPAAR